MSLHWKHRQRRIAPKQREPRTHPFPVARLALAVVAGVVFLEIFSALRKPAAPISDPSRKQPPATDAPPLTLPSPNGAAGAETNTAAAVGVSPLSDAAQAAEDMNRGTELFQQRKFQQAAALYAEAVRLVPDDETAHFNLALALARLGRSKEARQHYLEALRLFPEYAEAHNNLGNLLASQGQLDQAIEHFNQAVKAAPDSASAHNSLGTALMTRGKAGEAFAHFSEAVRLMPDYVEAHCNLGSAYLAQGKTNEAVSEFKKALQLKPDFAPANLGLARAQPKP